MTTSTKKWVTSKDIEGKGSGPYNGYLFGTSPNQVFLPAAGYRKHDGGASSNRGSYGYYWILTIDGNMAKLLNFSSSSCYVAKNGRVNGYSVRCVQE